MPIDAEHAMSDALPRIRPEASSSPNEPAVPLPSPVRSAAAADWLARLNDAQRRAVTFCGAGGKGARDPASGERGLEHEGGQDVAASLVSPPLLVIAGAGTGKTATLAHRVAWLVVNGVD